MRGAQRRQEFSGRTLMTTSTRQISVPGRQRTAADDHVATWDVLQLAGRFAEEVMVIGRVGVEIGTARFDDDFAKQTRIRELMKGVVNRRKRHLDRRACRLGVQLLER